MPPAHASASTPRWANDAKGLMEFASRLTFSTRLPEWQDAPAHEALLRLAADVALQLRLAESPVLDLAQDALSAGLHPHPANEAEAALPQEEVALALALALRRGAPEPDAFWFG